MQSKLKKQQKWGIQDLGVYKWHTPRDTCILDLFNKYRDFSAAKMAHHIQGIIIYTYIYIYINCILELVHKSCYMF